MFDLCVILGSIFTKLHTIVWNTYDYVLEKLYSIRRIRRSSHVLLTKSVSVSLFWGDSVDPDNITHFPLISFGFP